MEGHAAARTRLIAVVGGGGGEQIEGPCHIGACHSYAGSTAQRDAACAVPGELAPEGELHRGRSRSPARELQLPAGRCASPNEETRRRRSLKAQTLFDDSEGGSEDMVEHDHDEEMRHDPMDEHPFLEEQAQHRDMELDAGFPSPDESTHWAAAERATRVNVPIDERLAEGPAHVHNPLRPGPGVRVRRRTELEKPSRGPAGNRGLKGAAAAAAAFEAATSLQPPVSPGSGAAGVVVATPGLASRIHNTHKAAEHRGALWCWKCGGWSNSARRGTVRTTALVQQCRMPTPSGKAVLSRLRRMLPPDSKSRGIWPEDVPRAYAG
jgi:hypothetical protein